MQCLGKGAAARAVSIATVLVVGACGEQKVETPQPRETSGEEQPAAREAPSDALSVTGLRGTLSQEEIRRALDPRMPKFARCIQTRAAEVEWLAGGVTLEFRVQTDGAVAYAYPRESSLGDRATERCVVEVAQATRFPVPRGGEADFSWSFEMPLDSSIREPVSLADDVIASALAKQSTSIAAACGGGGYGVTAYVDPAGKVVAAGAAALEEPGARHLDCVADTAAGFVFPSPGSYAAKIRFSVP